MILDITVYCEYIPEIPSNIVIIRAGMNNINQIRNIIINAGNILIKIINGPPGLIMDMRKNPLQNNT